MSSFSAADPGLFEVPILSRLLRCRRRRRHKKCEGWQRKEKEVRQERRVQRKALAAGQRFWGRKYEDWLFDGVDVNANFKLVVFPTIILVKASPLQEEDGHSPQDNETDFTSLKFAFTHNPSRGSG